MSNDAEKERFFILDCSVISELVNLDLLEELNKYKKIVHVKIVIPVSVQTELDNEDRVHEVFEYQKNKGLFKIMNPSKRVSEELHFRYLGLGDGEIGVLALAITLKGSSDTVFSLIDDKQARNAARNLGLQIHGTLWLLIEFVKKRVIEKSTALEAIRKMPKHGFHLDGETQNKAIRKIQRTRQS